MRDSDEEQLVGQTRAWIESVVVGCDFCPFARAVVEQQRLFFSVHRETGLEKALETLIFECFRLDRDQRIETTLLIFADGFEDFDDFLDLVELANALLTDQGYRETYQLASFHPQYCFADVPADDPANYTNRSPWPMLHLLRESSITKALQAYPGNPEDIPRRNIEVARSKGSEEMKAMLSACYRRQN